MSTYLAVNLLIVIVPLAMSFERKLKFYKNYKYLIFSIVAIGVPFLVWDIIAEKSGDWMFNNKFILEAKIFNLPLEEILFFITVPYSIIFLYETFIYYIPSKQNNFNKKYFIYLSIVLLIVSAVFKQLNYTFVVFLFLSILFLIIGYSQSNLFKNEYIVYFLLFSFVPFLIVNYFLTSLPIVIYNPKAIWGIRIFTIPLEDFFYSLCLIIGYLFTYDFAKEKWLRKSVQ